MLKQGQLSEAPSARWFVLAGLWIVYASFGVLVTSIAPLVSDIVTDLDMSHSAMGSIMDAWQLVYIGAAIPAGMLLDRLGGRHALLIGVLVVALSGLGRSVAADYWQLLLAVMLFGIGGPIISSGAPKLVAEYFTGSQRGLAMGIYMTGPAMGGVASLSLTHAILLPWLDGDWRNVMLFWTALTVAAGILWWLLAHLFMKPQAEQLHAQNTPQVTVMKSLLVEPSVRIVLLMSVGVFLYNHGLNNWLVELLRSGGMEARNAGYWATLPTLVGIAGSLLIPRLATPERRFKILAALCILAFVASVLLQYTETLPLTVGLIMQGIARSSMMTVLILTLVELPGIGEQRAGVASGLFFTDPR